jgi:TonB family protein
VASKRIAVDSPIKLRGTGQPQNPARPAGLRFKRLFPAIILSLVFHVGLFTTLVVKSWIALRFDSGASAEAAVSTPARFAVGIDQGDGSGPGNSHSEAGPTETPGAQADLPLVAMSQIPSSASTTMADPLVGALIDAEESRAGGVSIGGPGGNGTGTASGGTSTPGWGMGGSGGTAAYMRNPPPPYPLEAVRRRWEGTTLLRVEVLPDGTVGTIEIAESSGYPVLDQASLDTVRNWKFSPARAGDTPIRSMVEIPISFHLAANQSAQPRD